MARANLKNDLHPNGGHDHGPDTRSGTLLEKFGQAIRQRRLSAGLSQEAFADIVPLHRTYIGAIERGE